MKLSLQTVQTLLMVIVVPVLGYIARKQADQGERLARIEQAILDQRHDVASHRASSYMASPAGP